MAIAYEYRPGVLYLNVTNRCSNDCQFCVRQGPGYSLGGVDLRLAAEPDAAEVRREIAAAELARGRPFSEVVFCGFGEPTYRLDVITEVGRWLRDRRIPVRLNTNGQAALILQRDPQEVAQQLATAVDCVSISLNAPDAETYEDLCQPSFEEQAFGGVLDFARACLEHVDRVVLSVVGFALSDADVDRCEALADELGAELRVR